MRQSPAQPLDRQLLGGFVAVFVVLQAILAFRLNINWDEYYYLSHIHASLDGRLEMAFQTFHVRPLAWLAMLPFSDPDQIVAGRFFMLGCELVSLYCVFRIARTFVSVEGSLLAVIAWCASGYALAHGMSFRADPFASALKMAALALLFAERSDWRRAALAGALAAIGLLITAKAVFYLPAFAAAVFWRLGKDGGIATVAKHFAIAAIALVVTGSALWFYHSHAFAAAVAPAGGVTSATTSAATQSSAALDKTIFVDELFPRWDYIRQWLGLSMFSLALIAIGAWQAWRSGGKRIGSVATLLILPLLCLVFYRNAFAYFFPFIFLPAAIVAAWSWEALHKPLWRYALLGAMAATTVSQFAQAIQRDQSSQRAIAQAVEQMFPQPVRYIDRNGMIPSFPKVGFFMSSWGMEGATANGRAALLPVIEKYQPPLVIANTPTLRAAFDIERDPRFPRLAAADEEALRANYIEHWGPIWVAGKRLVGSGGAFTTLIEGRYTIECEGDRAIDAKTLPCGSTIDLETGDHSWSRGPLTLRWGDQLYRPQGEFPDKPIYYGF